MSTAITLAREKCPRCGLMREVGDHKLLESCIRALRSQLRFLARDVLPLLRAVTNGYTYDPGSSDLDDEQPISARMTLGDYRRARRLLTELEKR